MKRAASAVVVMLLAGCAAGSQTSGVRPDLGHTSVAELAAALASVGLPCRDMVVGRSSLAEETSECTLDGQEVDLVHFVDTAQARRFAEQVERQRLHAALAETWAVVTPTKELAERVADALGAPRAV